MGGYFLRSCDSNDVISNLLSRSVHFLRLSTRALIHSRDTHRCSRRLANCSAVSSIPPLEAMSFREKEAEEAWVLLRRGSLDDLPPGLLFGQATRARTSGYPHLGMDGRFNCSPSSVPCTLVHTTQPTAYYAPSLPFFSVVSRFTSTQ